MWSLRKDEVKAAPEVPKLDPAPLPARGASVADQTVGLRHFQILMWGFLFVFGGHYLHEKVDRLFVHAEPPESAIIFPKDAIDLMLLGTEALVEVGIAFVIAFIVSWFVELRAAKRHIQSLEEARGRIESDVHGYLEHAERRFDAALALLAKQKDELLHNAIAGAFQHKFDVDYVHKALDTVFGHSVIREGYELEFRLAPLTNGDLGRLGGAAADRFVKLTAEANYRVLNVTRKKVTISSRYGVPIREDLPDTNCLVALSVGARDYDLSEIRALETFDEGRMERDYRFDIEIPAGESVKIMTRAVLIKDMSDNEPFGFIHPTSSLILRVNSEIPTLEVGANDRTATKMEPSKKPAEKSYGEWRVNGAILPHDSIVIWWRPRSDERPLNSEPNSTQLVFNANDIAESNNSAQPRSATPRRRARPAPLLHQDHSGGRDSLSAAPAGGDTPEGGAN